MKTIVLSCALVIAAAPVFAEEDSTMEKAMKVDALKKADKKDVEKAIQYDAVKNADKEDVEDAAKLKMLKDASKK